MVVTKVEFNKLGKEINQAFAALTKRIEALEEQLKEKPRAKSRQAKEES